jgi:hypothetical protein
MRTACPPTERAPERMIMTTTPSGPRIGSTGATGPSPAPGTQQRAPLPAPIWLPSSPPAPLPHGGSGTSPRRGGRSALTFVAGVVLGAALVSAAWIATTAESEPRTFDLTGTMTLVEGGTTYPSPGCHGSGGYSDIDTGTSVTVYDAGGTVVATGSLGQGRSSALGGCTFPISVRSVPEGSAFYQVEVSHRGKITYQAADAQAGGVSVSLGD